MVINQYNPKSGKFEAINVGGESKDKIYYQGMAEAALAKLRERMSEIEFKAWQYRSFGRHGMPMEKWDWRMVWMMAANEVTYPTQCECGGAPDREIVCRLCQSIAHVSSIDLVEA